MYRKKILALATARVKEKPACRARLERVSSVFFSSQTLSRVRLAEVRQVLAGDRCAPCNAIRLTGTCEEGRQVASALGGDLGPDPSDRKSPARRAGMSYT
jgi:hypothetical protein